MNQIPNIEETMRRGIKLIAGRIEALHPQYFLDETTYKHDVKGTMDVVKGVMADIEETHHHQLQKAREEERERAVEIIKDELRTAPLEVQMTKGIIFASIVGRIQTDPFPTQVTE